MHTLIYTLQLHLYLLSLAVMGSILLVFFLSLSSWFTVHACYAEMYRMSDYITYGGNEDQHQPLLNRYFFGRTKEEYFMKQKLTKVGLG